ncbi:MAG TPA: peptide chain release factor N(5)-glutamine methyltransferase [Blastocatellia bacterium]|nr:peptide chain release factor N(5)-glutamine methyltransferase [Blastocatellia bacterium]
MTAGIFPLTAANRGVAEQTQTVSETSLPTIAQAIADGAARLRASQIDEDRRTAGVLLCHTIRIDRTHLLTRSEEVVAASDYEEYLRLVARRAAGEPLQYITGHQEFYGLEFVVTPDVLIPRPETELLVERVIRLAGVPSNASPMIVDLGTGSGCIAVTLAVHLPQARLIATDISSAALDIARTNAELHRVDDRIRFIEGDALEPLAGLGFEGVADIIASNPPYVEEATSELVQREVREWEPHTALFAGADGLDFYRRLLLDTPRFLKPGGFIVLEIGFSQLESISAIIAGGLLELVDITHDLQGIPRTICLRRVV